MKPEDSEPTPIEIHEATLQGLISNLLDRHSPITNYVVLGICLVFLAQEIAAVYFGASILGVTSYFFLYYPIPAWFLTFFLHKGVMHFLANVALISFVGRVVESEFSKRGYLTFIVGTVVLSSLGAYLAKAPFTAKPVAAYGASGFGFALAAYSLRFPLRHGDAPLNMLTFGTNPVETPPAERIAFLLGVSAVVSVVVDLFTGQYLTTEWVNGAHLVGVIIGILVQQIRP